MDEGVCRVVSDYFVNGSRSADGDGTAPSKAFRTITEALDAIERLRINNAAASDTPSFHVHVAAGRYDAALGERFPLSVRGVILEGAGEDRTIIQGTGLAGKFWLSSSEYQSWTEAYATLLAGSDDEPTSLSQLSVASGDPPLDHASIGILCDRGGFAKDGGAVGSTTVDHIHTETGYFNGVAALASTWTGCKLKLSNSKIEGAHHGVFASGTVVPNVEYNSVSIEIEGNQFSLCRDRNNDGTGLVVHCGVAQAKVYGNQFVDNSEGLSVHVRGGAPVPVEIVGNEFRRNSRGIFYGGSTGAFVKFESNVISETSSSYSPAASASEFAPAILIFLQGTPSNMGWKARNNLISNNDTGIVIDAIQADLSKANPQSLDWGTDQESGGNTLSCNSRIDGITNRAAGDVVWMDTASPQISSFVGNMWDHAPPTATSSEQNGGDVIAPITLARGIVNGAVKKTDDCMSGRVSGPPP